MTRLPRRRLLQLAAATAGAGVLAVPGRAHAAPARMPAAQPQAAAAQDTYSFERATQAGFVPIASTLTFGEPVDVASGWDGSVWAVDDAGAPHTYDPVHDRWEVFGSGIDAACYLDGAYCYFRGAELHVDDGSGRHPDPLPIGTVWPGLPAGFKLGVQGAAAVGASLYLFRGAEFVTVDLAQRRVLHAPAPISQVPGWQGRLPADWAASGIDAAYRHKHSFRIHKGPAIVDLVAPGAPEVPATATPGPSGGATATPEPAGTATPTEQPDVVVYAALLPLQATAAVPTGPTGPILPTATSPAAQTPTPTVPTTATPTPTVPTPTVPATASPAGSATASPAGSATASPAGSATPTPSPGASATPGLTATLPAGGTPTASPTAEPVASTGVAQPQYVAAALSPWPITWNAFLQQAPRGRLGGLWAVAAGGAIVRHDGERWTPTPGAAVSGYLPYADLPGSSYSAVNTPAGRPAVVLQPAGLSYASNDANSVAPAAAASAIDALQGRA